MLLLLALPVLLAIGLLAAVHYNVFEGDSLSRAYGAASVLYGDHPAIANIGLIWPPLPILLQVPFAMIRPLANLGLTPVFVSVAFSTFSLLLLNRVLLPLLPDRRVRWAVLVLYQTNAMILIYAINGMLESALISFVLLGVWAAQRLLARAEMGPSLALLLPLATMGASSALALLSRYEGSAFALVLLLAIGIAFLGRPFRRKHVEAYLILYLTPVLCAVGLWLAANWMVTGDPLHFLHVAGGNRSAVSEFAVNAVRPLAGNTTLSAILVLQLLWDVSPSFYLAAPLLVALAIRSRDRLATVVALALVSFPAFQVVMEYTGRGWAWHRFLIYAIPLSIIGLALVAKSALASHPRLVGGGLMVTIVASSAITFHALLFPTPMNSLGWYGLNYEPEYLAALAQGQTIGNYKTSQEIGNYIRTMVPSGRILADDLQADHIVLFSGQMERFVTTRSPDHLKIADQPVGQVDYVLVPDDVDGTQNFIVERYPDIFDKGAPFLQLQKEWTDVGVRQNAPERWRLYRVRSPSEAGKEGNA